MEDQFVSLSLASLLRSVRLGRPYQEYKVPAGIARKVIEAHKLPHHKVETFWGDQYIYIYIYIYISPPHMALHPNAVQGLHIQDVSRSHITAHHILQDSSGRVIGSSPLPLLNNI